MDTLKKHVDTVIILSAFAASILWMNGKFNDVEKRFSQVDKEIAEINKEISVMKAVMIMKNIMTVELDKSKEQ
jgi:hypothetical protein